VHITVLSAWERREARLIDDELAAHSGWTTQNEPSCVRGNRSGIFFRRVDRQTLLGVLFLDVSRTQKTPKSKANQPDLTASTSGAKEGYHSRGKGKKD